MKTIHAVLGVVIIMTSMATSRAARAVDPVLQARQTLALFQKEDPSIKRFIDGSAGYAVFPSVGKAALGVGGAHGSGVVFQRGGKPLARATLTQVTIGAQAGGQEYAEVIFFENPKALSDFMSGEFTLAAQASAVALAQGAAKSARYKSGVAVFTATSGGLMLEASVGGQKFNIKPLQ